MGDVPAIARQFRFVREAPAGSNAGRWVEAIQRIGGASKGDPWCACAVSLVLGIAYQGKPPLPYTASCDVLLEHARAHGMLRETPSVGDVFLVMKTPRDAVHTGIVENVSATAFKTWEGNSSDPDKPATREGWGWFNRTRKLEPGKYLFIHYQEAVP